MGSVSSMSENTDSGSVGDACVGVVCVEDGSVVTLGCVSSFLRILGVGTVSTNCTSLVDKTRRRTICILKLNGDFYKILWVVVTAGMSGIKFLFEK